MLGQHSFKGLNVTSSGVEERGMDPVFLSQGRPCPDTVHKRF